MTLQPTGSCNFSRLDTKIMRFSNNNGNISSFFGNGVRQIRVFTVCYNILRIASGLGGLAFGN